MALWRLCLPDELTAHDAPFSRWLPAVLEISLLAFKTPAVKAAGGITEFLATNTSLKDVHTYHASERAPAATRYIELPLQTPQSYVTEQYFMLHAFAFTNREGEITVGRFYLEPVGGA